MQSCSFKNISAKCHQPIYTSMNPVLVSNVQGFAAEAAGEQVEQETPMQASLHRRSERKVCTGCKVDKPASEFRASGSSRDGLQHFCIPCKVCAGAPLICHESCHGSCCGPNRTFGHHTHLCRRDLGLLPALVSLRSIGHRLSWRCPRISSCSLVLHLQDSGVNRSVHARSITSMLSMKVF